MGGRPRSQDKSRRLPIAFAARNRRLSAPKPPAPLRFTQHATRTRSIADFDLTHPTARSPAHYQVFPRPALPNNPATQSAPVNAPQNKRIARLFNSSGHFHGAVTTVTPSNHHRLTKPEALHPASNGTSPRCSWPRPTSTPPRSASRSSRTAALAGSTRWFCCRSETPSSFSGSAMSAWFTSCGRRRSQERVGACRYARTRRQVSLT